MKLLHRCIAICGGILISLPVFSAEGDLITPYVSYGVNYDSNVFRLSGDSAAISLLGTTDTADTSQHLGVGLDSTLNLSRQVISLHADLAGNFYNQFDELDHSSGNINFLWDWSYGDAWKGEVGYNFSQGISNFEERDTILKDETSVNEAYFTANHSLTPRWAMEVGLNVDDRRHDLAQQKKLNRKQASASAELRYSTRRYSYVGLLATVSTADFPNRELVSTILVDNSYTENELGVTVNWVTTGKSRLKGRIGYTRRDHDEFPVRDFSGATGKLQYIWEPKGKLKMDVSVWKGLNAYVDSTSSYVDEIGLGVKPTWLPTAKIEVSAEFARKQREYSGDPGLTSSIVREDDIYVAGVSLAYKPRRNINTALSYQKEARRSNIGNVKYDVYSIFAYVDVRF